MTTKQHLISAVPLSLVVGLAFGSPLAGITAGAAAVLVDVDHVLDYTLSHGRFRSIKHLYEYCYGGQVKRYFLLAHSYEFWLLALFILPMLLPHNLSLGLLMGWLVHLLLDQLFNPAHPLTYFFLFRLKVKFANEKIKTPQRNLYTDLALKLGLPQLEWTRPKAKSER